MKLICATENIVTRPYVNIVSIRKVCIALKLNFLTIIAEFYLSDKSHDASKVGGLENVL